MYLYSPQKNGARGNGKWYSWVDYKETHNGKGYERPGYLTSPAFGISTEERGERFQFLSPHKTSIEQGLLRNSAEGPNNLENTLASLGSANASCPLLGNLCIASLYRLIGDCQVRFAGDTKQTVWNFYFIGLGVQIAERKLLGGLINGTGGI